MISLQGLTKRFGRRAAVCAVSLEVPRGVIYGLLGHNGAGKSTTIGMLLGQIIPDEGRALIDGQDVAVARQRALAKVGAIYETPAFYDYLSGRSNLRVLSEYTGPVEPRRIDEVVRLVGLQDRIDDRVATYSHGMRQRLAFAQALLPQPEMLLLDEPGEGLDPEGIHELRELILGLNRESGLTILLSSHLLSEIQQLCSHVAILREGHLLFAGDWRDVKVREDRVRIQATPRRDAEQGLVQAGLVADFDDDGCGCLAPSASAATVARWLVEHGFQIHAIAPADRTLESFYLETTRGDAGPATGRS